MKSEEAYTEYTSTSTELFAAEIMELQQEKGFSTDSTPIEKAKEFRYDEKMQAIIIPLLIFVAIIVFTNLNEGIFGDINIGSLFPSFSDFTLSPSKEKGRSTTPPADTSSAQPILEAVSPIFLDTALTNGVADGSVFLESSTITFEFAGSVTPEDTEGTITYETKVEGIDEDWKKTSKKSRTITVPRGSEEYTFLARAKLGNAVDSTPVSITFYTNISEYFGKVVISKVMAPTSARPLSLTLSPKLAKGEELNITGWEITSTIDNYIIPQGVPLYTGDRNTSVREDIILKTGRKVVISSAFNPLANNINFRVNTCFGFLEGEFGISLPESTSCLKEYAPTLEEVSFLSPVCQDFILKNVKGCSFPDYSENRDVLGDFSCVAHLKRLKEDDLLLTYARCFEDHSGDSNFLRSTWYVYTEGDVILRVGHDRVTLRDPSGLLVDREIY